MVLSGKITLPSPGNWTIHIADKFREKTHMVALNFLTGPDGITLDNWAFLCLFSLIVESEMTRHFKPWGQVSLLYPSSRQRGPLALLPRHFLSISPLRKDLFQNIHFLSTVCNWYRLLVPLLNKHLFLACCQKYPQLGHSPTFMFIYSRNINDHVFSQMTKNKSIFYKH